jgi:pilus assembly protein TadC
MDTVYRIFMYLFPYAVSLALYVWMFRRAQRVPQRVYKLVASAIIVAGVGYTIYRVIKTVSKALTDDNFQFQILIVTIIVLFLASIAMALGEPEK